MATCEECKRIINNLADDKSRTPQEILKDLEELRDEIEDRIDGIQTDIEWSRD